MRIGVLTGGGDCPGLNAAIRAIAHRAWMLHDEVCGFREGWAGLLGEGNSLLLTSDEIGGILHLEYRLPAAAAHPIRLTVEPFDRAPAALGGDYLYT